MAGDGESWGARAICRTADPEELFVEGAAQNRAKAACTGCPVRTECLAYALDHRIEHGAWGGMTDRERRALLRRRPTVTSWRRLLEAARTQHNRQALPEDDERRASAGLSMARSAAASFTFPPALTRRTSSR
ncbi:WhiB family transcriptional regulator [Streptomyces acidiscabies]|uniref:Transcriptional regulator WhiB n=1 Tax=Streptomyces acidiscabies TaxID=42234 RepID=A0ABU4ME79_9ACTN|nr:WhiB family transcriptional regulator [Streptomyces acidiscabies]MDX3026181.1 WhiB family transcriptional regulator [Streptomyces acidiscabies]